VSHDAPQRTNMRMAEICKSYGFWPGYVSLCLELDRRIEAFTNIVHLDDMNLLDGEHGSISETVEEWKFLLHLAQSRSTDFHCHGTQNGNTIGNGSTNWSNCITVENVALLLAKIIGPDRALPVLQECDLTAELSERFTRICKILRIAEKRQSWYLLFSIIYGLPFMLSIQIREKSLKAGA
uniref:HPS5 TPR domain-containing protein n=1 Tax=Gopherus evgoodei TaxID=1825980 RepID=A0A8C4WJC9_9SAUR